MDPKATHHTVSTNIDLVENDINALMKQPTKKIIKSNLTYKEYIAMEYCQQKINLTCKEHVPVEELAKREELIITNAYKGGAVVIMDTDSCIEEANRQLSDKASQKQLTQDPTLQHNRMINQTIERFKNEKLLPKKTADGLKVSNQKTPKFYISPKLHKLNNPRRPVINSIECYISEISGLVDQHLQPGGKTNSFIHERYKNTNHFINKLNNFSAPVNSV